MKYELILFTFELTKQKPIVIRKREQSMFRACEFCIRFPEKKIYIRVYIETHQKFRVGL